MVMMTIILFFRYWPDVPYIDIEKGVDLTSNMFQNLDYIASVCPCAGLSMLNTSRGTKARSADAEQNQWMYKSSDFILDKIKPKVSTYKLSFQSEDIWTIDTAVPCKSSFWQSSLPGPRTNCSLMTAKNARLALRTDTEQTNFEAGLFDQQWKPRSTVKSNESI